MVCLIPTHLIEYKLHWRQESVLFILVCTSDNTNPRILTEATKVPLSPHYLTEQLHLKIGQLKGI